MLGGSSIASQPSVLGEMPGLGTRAWPCYYPGFDNFNFYKCRGGYFLHCILINSTVWFRRTTTMTNALMKEGKSCLYYSVNKSNLRIDMPFHLRALMRRKMGRYFGEKKVRHFEPFHESLLLICCPNAWFRCYLFRYLKSNSMWMIETTV